MAKTNIGLVVIFCFQIACNAIDTNNKIHDLTLNGKMISDPIVQESLFRNLLQTTENSISKQQRNDSLSFLILPVRSSCPACRKKTIDSIAKYNNKLDDHHFIIIAGNGIKSISGYFEEEGKKLPMGKGIFYDTLDIISNANMALTNPNVYYSLNNKVYRKVSCLPKTIKEDLREFFANLKFEN